MEFLEVLQIHSASFAPVVNFNPTWDRLYRFDFSANNAELTMEQLSDTEKFSQYIHQRLEAGNYRYGIGGYAEHRTVYARSPIFDTTDEPRRLHLGVDIWGAAGTQVYAPLPAKIHSFAFNNRFGDYGATLILAHELEGLRFHTLYGHLSLASIQGLTKGASIQKGEQIGTFGVPQENGHWPPHLHFQLIIDLQGMKGDYPGVCRYSESAQYFSNCPDPDLILKMNRYLHS